MKFQLKINSESIVGLAIILMGMYFFYFGSFIESFGDDVVGPQFVPRITALTLALLGLVLLVLSVVRFEGDSLKDPIADLVGTGFFTKVFFPLGLTAIVYVTLFSQFGYFASTLIVTTDCTLDIRESRNPKNSFNDDCNSTYILPNFYTILGCV